MPRRKPHFQYDDSPDTDSGDGPCTEPDGNIFLANNEVNSFPINDFQHNIMLNEAGYCPWCGEGDEPPR